MLGKLMKHEFRATARIMLPVMGAMVALALLANLSIRGLAGNLSDVPSSSSALPWSPRRLCPW